MLFSVLRVPIGVLMMMNTCFVIGMLLIAVKSMNVLSVLSI